MTIGERHFVVRRRWLALLSLAWIAAIYELWMLFNSPSVLADHDRTQCASFANSFPQAYAECLQFVAQTMNDHHAHVATMATLVAAVPVALLWGGWLAARLLRECRAVECAKPTVGRA